MSFAFTKEDLEAQSLGQKVAIMESLIVALTADGATPDAETDRFDREVEAIPWGMERAELIAELTAARQRIMALESREAGVALIERAAATLDTSMREKVFRAMASIIRADMEMNKAELGLLRGYASAFGISNERIEQIKAAVDAST